jgi:hypothetical protein
MDVDTGTCSEVKGLQHVCSKDYQRSCAFLASLLDTHCSTCVGAKHCQRKLSATYTNLFYEEDGCM